MDNWKLRKNMRLTGGRLLFRGLHRYSTGDLFTWSIIHKDIVWHNIFSFIIIKVWLWFGYVREISSCHSMLRFDPFLVHWCSGRWETLEGVGLMDYSWLESCGVPRIYLENLEVSRYHKLSPPVNNKEVVLFTGHHWRAGKLWEAFSMLRCCLSAG